MSELRELIEAAKLVLAVEHCTSVMPVYRALRRLRDALAALDAAEVPTKPEVAQAGWQPIETAPKNGRQLIVGATTIMGWNWGISRYERLHEHVQGWISHSSGAWGNLGLAHPTHWMPLPEPPKED